MDLHCKNAKITAQIHGKCDRGRRAPGSRARIVITKLVPVTSSNLARSLFVPTVVMALVNLVFGLVTVFWQVPTLTGAAIALGLFFIGLGAANFMTSTAVGAFDAEFAPVVQALKSVALLQLAGGVLTMILPHTSLWVIVVGSLVLGISGVLTMLLGLRGKDALPVDKDWRIAGFVLTVAGALIPVIGDLGAKAILGVSGGGALIAGIFMMIGALTVRSDAKKIEAR